jgi:hypothetical protein
MTANPAVSASIQFLIRSLMGGTPERVSSVAQALPGRSSAQQNAKSLSFPLRRRGFPGWRNAARVC